MARYELSESQWEEIRDTLPGKAGDRGRTAKDNRAFVNGVLWVLRSGAFWKDVPERYGNWKTVHKRFTRWAKSGVWERIFQELLSDSDNEYRLIDSTIVRAHQTATSGKGGLGRRR
jgi:putative transposase